MYIYYHLIHYFDRNIDITKNSTNNTIHSGYAIAIFGFTHVISKLKFVLISVAIHYI